MMYLAMLSDVREILSYWNLG